MHTCITITFSLLMSDLNTVIVQQDLYYCHDTQKMGETDKRATDKH